MPEQTTATPLRANKKQPAVRVSVCLESGIPIPTDLMELTRVDMMFLTDRPLRYGTPLQMAMFGELVTNAAYVKAHVHYCRATHRGWQIGVFLTQTLPDCLTQHSWDEMRSELRYECDWKAWVLWQSQGQLDPVRLQCYSISGMRMELNRRVPAGSLFSVFGSAGCRSESAVQGRVEWCRDVEGQILAGCYFSGRRGRDLPRMFGNLTDVHAERDAKTQSIPLAVSADELMSSSAEQECFLSPAESQTKDPAVRNFRIPTLRSTV